MNCSSCGAALPANSTVCEYCRAYNPIDLQGLVEFAAVDPATNRICPGCRAAALQTVTLATTPACWLDQCTVCGGLFFPPGGIEFLLDELIGPVYVANRELLANLQRELYRAEEIVYRKCPVCSQLMSRKSFGYRCGVVIDRCISHGDWLDSGEFLHLAQWRKAGGMLAGKSI